MKRSKRLFTLLGVLVVACIATFVVTQLEEEKEQIKATGEIVLELSSEDIQAFSWEYNETSLAFHKDETWLYDADEAFPVDQEAVLDLLEPFASFGVSFIIEEVSDYSMYGLDDPVCTIHLETEDTSYDITLGDFSNMDQERYVSIGDGNVYLAKNDPLDQFDTVLDALIQHDEDLAYQQVTQIKFEGMETYSIFYEEDSTVTYCPDDVYFTEQKGETLPLDTDRVGTYLEYLTTLDLTNYVTYNATQEELESYNLVTPELTVTVDYTAEDSDGTERSDTFVLSFSRNPEELDAAEEAEANGDEPDAVTGYIRIGDSQIVYQISASDCEELMAASYDKLRHREVLTADFEDIYQVDVTLEGVDYTIAASEPDKDGTRVWTYQEEEISTNSLQGALEGMRADSANSFTVDGSAGKEEIRITVYLDNENHPKVEIELYRYDGSDCLAKVDGEVFALIPRSDVVDLIEAINAIVLD